MAIDYVKRNLKTFFSFVVYYSGLINLFDVFLKLKNFGHVTVLVGHRVVEDSEFSKGANQIYIDWGQAMLLSELKRRLEYLKKRYRVVSIDEAMELISAGNLYERLIVLTFDDGYTECKKTVLSLAKKMEVPVTFFLSTSVIENKKQPWWDQLAHYIFYLEDNEMTFHSLGGARNPIRSDKQKLRALQGLANLIAEAGGETKDKACAEIQEKIKEKNLELPDLYMTRDDISMLSQQPLCTIGAHTVTHCNLSKMSYGNIEDEIVNSKKALERMTQKKISCFAYPHGYYNQKARDLMEKSDYDFAFAVENGKHDDFFAFRRVTLWPSPFPVFAVEAAGIIEYIKSKVGST